MRFYHSKKSPSYQNEMLGISYHYFISIHHRI